MIGIALPRILKRFLILLSVLFFLADLAVDGRLGLTNYDSQNKANSHSYELAKSSSFDHSHFDLQDFLAEHALLWQKISISPDKGLCSLASLPDLQPFQVRIGLPAFPSIDRAPIPYSIGEGCGGLPL
jgi:hypothetical protein